MREIKFRAWDKKEKKMIEVNHLTLYQNSGWRFCANCGLSIGLAETEYNLTQYTGLKDKNGKEIYEGDILSFVPIGHKKFNKPFRPFEIFWDEKNAQFSDWSPKEGERGAEVIGNIYENPELMETNP